MLKKLTTGINQNLIVTTLPYTFLHFAVAPPPAASILVLVF